MGTDIAKFLENGSLQFLLKAKKKKAVHSWSQSDVAVWCASQSNNNNKKILSDYSQQLEDSTLIDNQVPVLQN